MVTLAIKGGKYIIFFNLYKNTNNLVASCVSAVEKGKNELVFKNLI